MRKLFTAITVMALALCFGTAQARQLDLGSSSTLDLRIGGGFNLTDGARGDLFPTTFSISGDYTYMLNDNVGIVPVSVTFDRYGYDEDYEMQVNRMIEDVTASLPGDPETWPTDGDAYGFAYTPGVYWTSNTQGPLDVFAQLGAGVYYYDEELEILQNQESVNQTDFAALAAAGLEYNVTDNVSFTARSRYLRVDTDQSRDSMLGFTGGLKMLF